MYGSKPLFGREFTMFSRLFLCTVFAIVVNGRIDERKNANKIVLEPEVGNIDGYYVCRGVESGDKSYSGMVTITRKNDVYVIQWVMNGGATFTGIGIRKGNIFSASWATGGEKGIIRGINQYRIEPGPRFVGRWATLPGNGVLQTETLNFLKKFEDDQ